MKALEERIRRGETLAAIGALSAGIAHEIRNCLNPISGLGRGASEGAPRRRARTRGSSISWSGSRSGWSGSSRELLEYARERPLKAETVEAAALAAESIELARRHPSAAAGKRVSLDGPHSPVWIRVDFDQMKQVMTNLLINALEAIPESGTVTVVIREDQRSPGAWGRSGVRRAVLEFTDTGEGIAPKDVDQVFEPFFSTKQGGTGLGLAIANRIVERHGGRLGCREPDRRGDDDATVDSPGGQSGAYGRARGITLSRARMVLWPAKES